MRKFGVTGIPLLHIALNRPNDTGIMHYGLSEEEKWTRFEKLKSFANSKGEFGCAEIEKMVDYYFDQAYAVEAEKPRAYLTNTRGEMATMLTVFGHHNGSTFRWLFGFKVLTVDDMEALWMRNEWPRNWEKSHRKVQWASFTFTDVAMAIRFMIMKSYCKLALRMPRAFKPYHEDENHVITPCVPPYDNRGAIQVPSVEEIKECNIPNGMLSIYDSRMGGVQDLHGEDEWVFSKRYWQIKK
jgi:hypothetical protein